MLISMDHVLITYSYTQVDSAVATSFTLSNLNIAQYTGGDRQESEHPTTLQIHDVLSADGKCTHHEIVNYKSLLKYVRYNY